jgi:TonB family protein
MGTSRGSYFGSGSGIDSMPSAARQLNTQLNTSNTEKTARKASKGFEIAGPLNNRPIVRKVVPQYPSWAEEQGIIGSVRLYFTVTPEGQVRPNITVTKTTGYPRLDQLSIDALRQWQFSPLDTSEEGQWGIITFNFSLSS